MSAALNHLVNSAQPCKPIRADLRNSTVTFDWPANVLVRKADYIIVPADEALAALDQDSRFTVRVDSKQDSPPFCYWEAGASSYSARRHGRHYRLYFEYPGADKEHPMPSTWWGRVSFEDVNGVEWDSGLGRMVMDDFGDLVPVRR